MTPKEMREYEQGKAHGYSHPSKVHGWSKSAAWNHGMKAGQAEYWREWKKSTAREKAYQKYRREHGVHRGGSSD